MQKLKVTWYLRLLGNRKFIHFGYIQVHSMTILEQYMKLDGTIEYLIELLSEILNLPVVGIDDVVVTID